MKHFVEKIRHHAKKIPHPKKVIHHLKKPAHFVNQHAARYYNSSKFVHFVLALFFVSAFSMYVVFIIFVFFQNRDNLARIVWEKHGDAELAFKLNYKDADIAWQLGNFYFGQTLGRSEYDLDRAEAAFKKVLEIDPAKINANYQLGRIYLVRADYDKAITHLDKELKLNPLSFRSLYVRGIAYGYRWQGDDPEYAEQSIMAFINAHPKEWGGYNDLAWVQSKRGKDKRAKETIQGAMKKANGAKDNPWIWNALGVAELNLEEYLNAAKSFENALLLAKKINLQQWREAYPGNDPAKAEEGIMKFIGAIEGNLERTKEKISN